ncbi:Cobalt/magnesium transport protein CorA [Fusobacterium sp. DD29]|uniref:magnesium/cobalt transporter CorA n=1 Tax=unclassified Fusobacterium TaxID=2648384 RepID=UPI001B8C1CE6|nr:MULTISPECIES: magnesium/cobalt transporter CorA [unclassified Fusobacterium]MBR8700436.1 Cobalt/magnesium transport protein CorA [Fusobacterium sp. DD45]MBR8710185.1 Cobalt/magnesium transport protein CorA [Fusobacterium sp. DD28]MBR8748742.1 Cobalt/magnesium transport protein CorA [Fusobacterium sp. DD29]MBR8750714.1 Cobalt/magnesium transport protein CorA [Fusobacterium sp. DD26]MBR8761009.1 Cobalt/magnesium transport protein CorA [Fusobacterium sp. DD25]
MDESKNRKKKIGLPPGSILYTGENPQHKVNIEMIAYNDSVIKREIFDEDENLDVLKKDFKGVKWINIDGIHNIALIKKIGDLFNLDNLVMEDVANSTQRAKVEEREDYLFIVLKMLNINLISKDITYEQISFIVGEDYLLTFQETPGDVLDSVRARIESPNYKMRKKSIGYLTYAILDSIVDYYFMVLDEVEIEIDKLESKVINDSEREDLQSIITLKQKVSTLKRTIGPIRELITRLQTKSVAEYLNEDIKIYLTDLSDHGIIVYDTLDILNTRVTELIQLYHSTISNGMNEIMKILAIISTVFMPLSFLTSLYGMNFDNMPELHTRYGYFFLLGAMFVLVLGMIAYFKNKKWF